MAYSKEMIEWLHDTGQMPDWAYYQQNGKSLQENYNAQTLKMQKRIKEFLNDRRRREEEARAEKELEAEIEKKVSETVENALNELLKDFI